MRQILLKCLLLMLIFMQHGCWDATEMEQLYYAHVVGIDYVEDEYEIYIKISGFAGVEGAEGGAREAEQAEVGIGRGDTVAEAIHDLYTYTQRRIYFGHLSAIILSVGVLEHDVAEALEVVDRFNEVRDTFWVYGTNEPLGEVLTEFPILDTSVLFSIVADPWDTYTQSSLIRPIKMNRFRSQSFEPGQTVFFPNVAKSDQRWFTDQDIRGNIGLNGAHFLQQQEYHGVLTGGDVLGLRWMEEETKRAPLQLEQDGQPAATLIIGKPQMEIRRVAGESDPRFSVHVSARAMVLELFKDITEAEIKREAESVIQKEIEAFYYNGMELGADVLQLSYHLYREDPDLWRQVTEQGQLELHEDRLSSVEVEVDVRHSIKNKLRHGEPGA